MKYMEMQQELTKGLTHGSIMKGIHQGDVTWVSWCLKSRTSTLNFFNRLINSLTPGRFELNFKLIISRLILVIDG